MNPPYRLAVFDMDDTLLGPDRELSAENAAALRRLRDRGVEVVIASGRHAGSITQFEHEIGFMGWIISAGGAVVSHAETGEVLYELAVPQELGLELVRRARDGGVSLIGYHRSGIYCDAQSEWIDLYTRRTHQLPVASLPDLVGSGLQKLIWLADRSRIARFAADLAQEFHERLYVVNTEHEMLEFLNPKTNKALATAALARHLGVAREEVLAFGDGNNDVPLLQWAGHSVAMAHGREAARRAARQVSSEGPPETAVARTLAEIFGD